MRSAASGALLLAALAGCSGGRDDKPVTVDVIGKPGELARPLPNSNTPAAKVMLGAIAQGLVSFDAHGDVVDALAESWIVEDGGQSYIFRLKRMKWPDGTPIKAADVARLLRERWRANPLWAAGLKPEFLAMTDRVIEIRFDTALPAFLQLLAQPQFGMIYRGNGSGPYLPTPQGDAFALAPVPPPDAEEDIAAEPSEQRILRADRGAMALARFNRNMSDLVLGGRFQHVLLAPAAGIAVNDLRVDPVSGLLGLAVTGRNPFLAQASNRDALARVIHRAAFAAALGMPGWRTSDGLLPAQLDLDRPPALPAWHDEDAARRLATAKLAVDRWVAVNGPPPMLRVALPAGPGASALFIRLARDFGQLGVRIDRVAWSEPADLHLIDEVAPFDSALWYLSRLDCAAGINCDPRASALLAQVRQAPDEAERMRLLGEAETLILANAGYIPIGQPIRWALVGRRLTGFQPSPRGIHPLNRLIALPN